MTSHPSSRRRFLLQIGATGLGLGTRPVVAGQPAERVIHRSRALGTWITLTVIHESRATADRAIRDALEAIETVESLMSIYREDSQISRLNRDGALRDPHPDLVQVLEEAQRISKASEGAFDVTVQPLWTCHARARQAGNAPTPEALEAARARVNWRALIIRATELRFQTPGMALTLNGIAQGYAADRARAALERHGVRQALLDTGEIGALGGSSGERLWKVGLQHPRQPDAFLGLAGLRDRCLATSGDYETAFTADFREHHLFDPRTGRSANTLSSVSVAAPNAMLADALSTAVFILGPEKGLACLAGFPGTDALLVTKDGRTRATANFPLAG